jgi:release factor glutamine methyltransferase
MSGNADQWTIGRLLTWTADFLKRHGSESPRLDAELLLAHARGCKRIDLYTAFHEVVEDAVRAKFREMVRQRSQGKPVAYLVGQREFYSLPFVVSPDVLIPRPETELVMVALIDQARSLDTFLRQLRTQTQQFRDGLQDIQ